MTERVARGRNEPMTNAAPYFFLARPAWIPCAVIWDLDSGEFRRVEGPRGCETYQEAVEASRFLRPLDKELASS